MHLFDTCGQERFKCISQVYYRNANVIVVVFDMTLPSTLINAFQWLKDALQVNEKSDPLIFLVGTKSDLVSKKSMALIERDAVEVAQQMNAEFFAVSSLTSCQVTKFFQRLAAIAFEQEVQRAITPSDINLFGNNIISKSEIFKFYKSFCYSQVMYFILFYFRFRSFQKRCEEEK